MRSLAHRLTTLEANGKAVVWAKGPVSFPVPEKLRLTLSQLIGTGGYQGLLARALALATEEVPWLRGVTINVGGVLEGKEELQAKISPEKFLEGRVVLVAQLLGLLESFIGETLTVRLVREAWPALPLNVLNLTEGEKNEKTQKTGGA